MFKICQNFRNIWNFTYCRVIVSCELMGLHFTKSHLSTFTELRHKESICFKCKLFKAIITSSHFNDRLCQGSPILVMPKRKRSTFQSKDREKKDHKKKKRNEKEVKLSRHKHKKSKKSHIKKEEKKKHHKKKHSPEKSKDKMYRSLRNKTKSSVPELIDIASSSEEDNSDIFVIYDSKAEHCKKIKIDPVAVTNLESVCTQSISDILKCKPDAISATLQITNVEHLEVVDLNVMPSESSCSLSIHEINTLTNIVDNDINNQQSTEYISSSVASPDHNGKGGTNSALESVSTPPPVQLQSDLSQCDSTCVTDPSDKWLDESTSTRADSGKGKFKSDRNWEFIKEIMANRTQDELVDAQQLFFKVLCYNVLSQSIMEAHPYLYNEHNPDALDWEYRSRLLFKELLEFNAEILCLQEVQQSHLNTFFSQLDNLGYKGIYKQRTGRNVDGVAIYYKQDAFRLTDYTTVEYYQPGVEVLNRDNVALVAKFAPTRNLSEHIIVATTHLLFNPRRHDVKLAQIQLLLAEVDRFAFKGYDESGVPSYWPVIITGDMNFEPHTGVYELLTKGEFQFEGRCKKTLRESASSFILDRQLIPQDLEVTDNCQHWSLLQHRPNRTWDHSAEVQLLKVFNSDHRRLISQNNLICESTSAQNFSIGFGTGKLQHALFLQSVYNQDPSSTGRKSQVTTYQNGWVVVDYIFYSNVWNTNLQKIMEGKLKLKGRYKLFSEEEAKQVGPIPNLNYPSDHYPLCAQFALMI